MRYPKTFTTLVTACAAATLSMGLGMGAASALPPGGASPNTAGTSSNVSSTVQPGGVINFSVSGFPANTMVSIKIDDGSACPSDAPQGACVIHQQVSDSSGTASGSFILPTDLSNGQHTLRFLAAGEKKNSKGESLGTQPFSNRSPVFTVTGGSSNGGSKSGGSSQGSSGGGSRSNGGSGSSSSANNGGSNSGGSAANGAAANSANGGGDNGSGGSAANGAAANSGSDAAGEEVEYLDADGNKITKEEYDRLNAEGGTEDNGGESGESGQQEERNNPSVSSKATAKANTSASQSGSSNKAQAKQETTNTTVTYGSEFPWIGTIVLVVAAIAAAVIVIVRKKA